MIPRGQGRQALYRVPSEKKRAGRMRPGQVQWLVAPLAAAADVPMRPRPPLKG